MEKHMANIDIHIHVTSHSIQHITFGSMLAQHWTDVFQQVANQICGAYLIGPTLAQKQYIYVPTKSVVYNLKNKMEVFV
jgi:hypothetical protein